jgi:hypothetical protein
MLVSQGKVVHLKESNDKRVIEMKGYKGRAFLPSRNEICIFTCKSLLRYVIA